MRSKEEKAADDLAKKVREAEKLMGEARFKRLVAPYQITQGVFPVWVTKALPSWLTYHSAFLFGTPGNKALRGLPAAAIRMLDLSHHDVRVLKKAFDRIDDEEAGVVSVAHLMHHLECEDTIFVRCVLERTIYGLADLNGDGVIDFPEFIIAVCVLCTYSKDQVLHKVFVTFDADGSGYLDAEELKALGDAVKSMSGRSNFSPGNLDNFTEGLDGDGDGLLEFQEFAVLNVTFPLVFYPAFRMQDSVQKRTLGMGKWNRKRDAWTRREKERAHLVEEDPTPMYDQLDELRKWYDGRRSAAEAKRVAKELAKNAAADRARMAKNGERPRPGTGSSRPGTGAGGKTKLPALKAVGNAAVVAGALQKAGGKAPPKTAWA